MIGWDLLRLEGYSSSAIEEDGDALIVDATLVDEQAAPCGCDAPDVVKHGTRTVKFKDFPIQRRPTTVRVTFQRHRCRSCKKVVQPEMPGIDPVRDITIRFRDTVRKDAVDMTFATAAAVNGLEDSFVSRVFDDYAEEALAHYTFTLPRVLGMDEKVVGGTPRFIVGDVEGRSMLDMQPSRKKLDLERYFSQFDMMDRAKVEVITQDMYWGYKELNERYFRNAAIVIDKFHVVRYADFAVSTVRKKNREHHLRDLLVLDTIVTIRQEGPKIAAKRAEHPAVRVFPEPAVHVGRQEVRILGEHPVVVFRRDGDLRSDLIMRQRKDRKGPDLVSRQGNPLVILHFDPEG